MRYSYTLHKCQFLSQANSPKSRQVNMISMQISSLEALLQILALSRDASFCSCYENFVHLVEGDEEQNSRAKTDLSTRSHPCLPITSPSVPPSIVPVRLTSQIISNYIFVKAFSRPRASTGPSKRTLPSLAAAAAATIAAIAAPILILIRISLQKALAERVRATLRRALRWERHGTTLYLATTSARELCTWVWRGRRRSIGGCR
jgi:hypothetical protein